VKLDFILDTFRGVSKKTKVEKDFYVVRFALLDNDKKTIKKSEPILWLTKEQYDTLKSSK
jgi:hypothetical protein